MVWPPCHEKTIGCISHLRCSLQGGFFVYVNFTQCLYKSLLPRKRKAGYTQFISPYTNYWHNSGRWCGGWHTRLILVNRSDKRVDYTLEHKPCYGFLQSFGRPMFRKFYQDDKAVIYLNPGEKADLFLEDVFGWQKDFGSTMEGVLRITPKPLEAREKTDVKLYIPPDKVTVESLKEKEKRALSDEAGVVVDTNTKP